MLSLNISSLLILAVYSYLMCCVIARGNMEQKGIATLIAAFLLLTNHEGLNNSNNAPRNNAPRNNAVRNNAVRNNAVRNKKKANNKKANNAIKAHQKNSTINKNGVQGVVEASMASEAMPYDGIVFSPDGCWMKQPDDAPLLSNEKLTSYLGSQGAVKMRYSDQNALGGPPIDGVQGSPEKMFMFANNRAAPECCPSTFSSSTGCVCTTKNQRDFIASRGRRIN